MESVIIERLQHVDDSIDIDEANLTPVQQFYKDAKVFVTGGTGFLGQILIDKLLRSTPVSTIYVMIRKKKGKDMETRLNEMFGDDLFSRMRKACPDFCQKIVPIEGDCALQDLGINDQDRKLLMDEVSVVFHVAATVRFDENLKTAVAINVRATRDLCRLARQMPQLKAFLQVSTAFGNCIHNVIEEKVYPTPISYKSLIQATEALDANIVQNLTSHFVGNYPNTYVYTKQIAEDVVKQETLGLPAGIYRPAIVVSTYKEPIRGWINNVYGATGVFYGAGIGLIRVLYCDEDSDANIVPVDMCVNGLIASAWDIAQKFEKSKKENEQFEIPVYNYESTNDKYINWGDFRDLSSKYAMMTPSVHCLWIYYLFLVKSYTNYVIMTLFLHMAPAIIADAVMYCRGKKMRLVKAFRKIHSFSRVIAYFSVRSFDFRSSSIHNMLAQMSTRDQEVFFCDLRKLDWDEFFITYGPGARIYLAKDPFETLPEAKKLWRRLQWANRVVVTIVGLIGLALLWSVMSAIYRFIFV